MEFGLGVLRWSEHEFWATSLRAYDRAVAGYQRSRGLGSAAPGMTRSRLEELKRQYPDTPKVLT